MNRSEAWPAGNGSAVLSRVEDLSGHVLQHRSLTLSCIAGLGAWTQRHRIDSPLLARHFALARGVAKTQERSLLGLGSAGNSGGGIVEADIAVVSSC